MPNNFRFVIGAGLLLAVTAWFFYGLANGLALALVTFCVGGIWLTAHAFGNCPKECRWHFLTALTWTMTLAIETYALIAYPETKSLNAYLVVVVAGLVWIPSWQRLRERWQGGALLHKPRPHVNRFLVQTLWGPLALFALVRGIDFAAQPMFENAVMHKDLSTATFLRSQGLGNVNTSAIHNGFRNAIGAHDAEAVSFYVAIGTPSYLYLADGSFDAWKDVLYWCLCEDNTDAMEKVLAHGASPNREVTDYGKPILHIAVERGKIAPVRLLLRYGADPKVLDNQGHTALQIADEKGDKRMIALLSQPTE